MTASCSTNTTDDSIRRAGYCDELGALGTTDFQGWNGRNFTDSLQGADSYTKSERLGGAVKQSVPKFRKHSIFRRLLSFQRINLV
jgi:hypothetical protein